MLRRFLLAVLLALAVAGCDSSGPDGPDVVLEVEELRPSSISNRFCVVHTVIRNRRDETVTVTIRWRAFNAAGVVIGTALDVISGIPPHGRAESDSTSFGTSVPCSAIARFERFETDVF
jgi:hypothetical protein